MAEEKLLKLAERYKESIFTKLSELAPCRIDRADLEGKTTEEVLSLIYL